MSSQKDIRTFARAMSALLSDGGEVLIRESQCKPFACDALVVFKQTPPIVVLPRSVAEVQAITRLCYQQSIPLVTRGAGTGLSGGATPHAQGVLMSVNRMNKIMQIDATNRRILVQPGVNNIAVSQAVAHLGLFFAPDPSSQIVSTIGGNIAENSGGLHCIKYGLTVHNVLEVEVVLSDGSLVTLNAHSGLDLLGAITGSEGMLGVVVSAWLKLIDKPVEVALLMAGFPSATSAAKAVADLISFGVTPSGMEMMDREMIHLTDAYASAGYPLDCEAMLLCELDGDAESVADQITITSDIFVRNQASSIEVAKNEQQRERMWKGRKSAFPAAGKIASDYYCIDGTVPRSKIGEVLVAIANLSKEYSLRVLNVFHAGDGNLHPLILFDSMKEGETDRAKDLGDKILLTCLEVGGTVTGEHGVGLEKLNVMCAQFSSSELEVFHRLRHAFDPKGIMNPGKAIPTLARCSELGGMHVHEGNIPYPEIERF